MTPEQIIDQAKRIRDSISDAKSIIGPLSEAKELTRLFGGDSNSFYRALLQINQFGTSKNIADFVRQTLTSFISHTENGLLGLMSIERKARIDVVSDILEQAQTLLDTEGIHPAAPAVLGGAALEEFLRNWIEDKSISLEGKKSSLDTYSTLLRKADLIQKQDAKDITSWAGIRNHAAHGEWDVVADKSRVHLMIEGINLFMRKYSS